MTLRWTLILAAAAAALTLAACGSEEGGTTAADTTSEEVAAGQAELAEADAIAGHIDASDVIETLPPGTVLNGDIAAEEKGTPERAFLEWVQAFQFHDPGAVEALTSKETLDAVGAKNLAEAVLLLGQSGVEILNTSEDGNRATIQAAVLAFAENKKGVISKKPTSSQPDAFEMVREDGEWKFADTDSLQLRIDTLPN